MCGDYQLKRFWARTAADLERPDCWVEVFCQYDWRGLLLAFPGQLVKVPQGNARAVDAWLRQHYHGVGVLPLTAAYDLPAADLPQLLQLALYVPPA